MSVLVTSPPSARASKRERNTVLGAWLTKQRGDRSQRQLAEIAGIGTQTIHVIEIGEVKNPRGTTIMALANALVVDPIEILRRCEC